MSVCLKRPSCCLRVYMQDRGLGGLYALKCGPTVYFKTGALEQSVPPQTFFPFEISPWFLFSLKLLDFFDILNKIYIIGM